MNGGSDCSPVSITHGIISTFNFSLFSGCKMTFHFGFLTFSWLVKMFNIFWCLIGICISSFWSIRSFAQFLNQIAYIEFLTYSDYKSFFRSIYHKYYLPFYLFPLWIILVSLSKIKWLYKQVSFWALTFVFKIDFFYLFYISFISPSLFSLKSKCVCSQLYFSFFKIDLDSLGQSNFLININQLFKQTRVF